MSTTESTFVSFILIFIAEHAEIDNAHIYTHHTCPFLRPKKNSSYLHKVLLLRVLKALLCERFTSHGPFSIEMRKWNLWRVNLRVFGISVKPYTHLCTCVKSSPFLSSVVVFVRDSKIIVYLKCLWYAVMQYLMLCYMQGCSLILFPLAKHRPQAKLSVLVWRTRESRGPECCDVLLATTCVRWAF